MQWIQWFVGLVGHLGLWCVAFNRIHATAWPRSSRKVSEKLILAIVVLPIAYVGTTLVSWTRFGFPPSFDSLVQSSRHFVFGSIGVAYAWICILLGVYFIFRWIFRKFALRLPAAVTSHRRRRYNLQAEINTPLLHGWFPRLLGWVPFNEVLQLTAQEMTFTLDVPGELDGLRICQLSDLHFTGHIGVEYFQKIVARANAFEPDLVLITGDLVDNPECLPWLDSTLGKLKSRYGCYYVLGNHDLRIKNESEYRDRLKRLNLIRAAGCWHSVCIKGVEVKLTGNELPWYPGADRLPQLPGAGEGADEPGKSDEGSKKKRAKKAGLKILLTHSPDQIDWARPHGFDLIFAGHTHGGQIALPVIGPLVAPSKYGVLYASGTFQIDQSVMHVSRGISGDEPIRLCSPPELGLFTIRAMGG